MLGNCVKDTSIPSGNVSEVCDLREWFLEHAQQQREAVESQLVRHHDALLSNIRDSLSQLERRLQSPALAQRPNGDVGSADGHGVAAAASDVRVDLCAAASSGALGSGAVVASEIDGRRAVGNSTGAHAGLGFGLSEGQRTPAGEPATPPPRMAETPSSRARQGKRRSFIKALTAEGPVDGSLAARPSTRFSMARRLWLRWRYILDFFITLLVLLNVLVLIAQMQNPRTPSPLIDVMESIVNPIFLIDIALRLIFEGRAYLTPLNLFDAMIVVVTCIDVFALDQLRGTTHSFRIIRFLRLWKTLRVVRAMFLFRHLRVLLATIASSFQSLIWSMIILCMCQLTYGLVICQMLQPAIVDPSIDADVRLWIDTRYGTALRAWYSFFEVTFSGGWPTYVRPLIEHVSPGYAAFFIVYIACVNFAIIRVISAMFLRETLRSAESDADMRIDQNQREVRDLMVRLQDIFEEADIDHNGGLSLDELERLLLYPKICAWFASIGVDTHDCKALFDLLDPAGNGLIGFDEFTRGIMRLKGPARSLDIAKFRRVTDRLIVLTEDAVHTCHGMSVKLGTL